MTYHFLATQFEFMNKFFWGGWGGLYSYIYLFKNERILFAIDISVSSNNIFDVKHLIYSPTIIMIIIRMIAIRINHIWK